MFLKKFLDTLIDDDTSVRLVLVETDSENNVTETTVLDTTVMSNVTYTSVKDYFAHNVCEIGAEISVSNNTDTPVVVVKICS